MGSCGSCLYRSAASVEKNPDTVAIKTPVICFFFNFATMQWNTLCPFGGRGLRDRR